MPVIIRFKNLKLAIYSDDHGNSHVHVIGPGAKAKIYLETLEIESCQGFSKKAINKIVAKVSEYQDILLEAWESYHGKKEDK